MQNNSLRACVFTVFGNDIYGNICGGSGKLFDVLAIDLIFCIRSRVPFS
jgi:hypothetical protein